jgi:hypothetical protein
LDNSAWGFDSKQARKALVRFLDFEGNKVSNLRRMASGRVWIYPRQAVRMHARITAIREGRWRAEDGVMVWCDPPRPVPRVARATAMLDFRGVHLGIMPIEPPRPRMPSPDSLFKGARR